MLPKNIRKQIADDIIRAVVPLAFIGSLVISIFTLFIAPDQPSRVIPPILFCITITPAWIMARKGRPIGGASFVLLCATVPILSGMILNGGIRAPVFIGILPIMAISYCLYGTRRTIFFSILAILVGAVFVVLETEQLLPQAPQPPAVLVLAVYGLWLAAALIFISVPVKMMFNALTYSDQKRREAEEAFAEKQSMQRELEKSETFRKRLFESSFVPIIVMDCKTNRFIECNPAAAAIYRFPSVAETLGKTVMDVSAPFQYDGLSSRDKGRYYLEKAMKDGAAVFEWRNQRPDGEVWDAEVHLMRFASEGRQFLQFTLNDITERKRIESEVLREKHFSETVLSQLPGSFYMFTQDGRMMRWNDNLERVTGYSAAEIRQMNMIDFFQEGDRDHVRLAVQNVFVSGPSHLEADFLTKDGRKIPHVLTGASIEYGGAAYMLGVGLDITERKQVEVALRESEEKYRQLIEMANDAIFIAQEGKITFFNSRTAEMLGYEEAEIQGASILTFVHPDDRQLVADRHIKRLRGEKGIPGTYLHKVLRKDHAERVVQLSSVLAEWNGMPATLNFARDITDQKRLEDMMIQNEKMLSVGGLAAGMAHEINNPLAGMMQAASVMSARLDNMETPANQRAAAEIGIEMGDIKAFMDARGILRMLSTITESGRRVSEIIGNMLSFARKGDTRKSSYDLNLLIDKSLVLAATDYSLKQQYDFKRIDIQKEYEDNLPLVVCEGAKIQQVLLNIIINGAQAMQTGETQNPRFVIRTLFEKEKEMVAVHISDNGPGMEEETRKRVFEPFYTTKPVGVGTGLGLSVSYFIITENHGGEMTVRSRQGSGAKFIIRLPLHGQEAQSHPHS